MTDKYEYDTYNNTLEEGEPGINIELFFASGLLLFACCSICTSKLNRYIKNKETIISNDNPLTENLYMETDNEECCICLQPFIYNSKISSLQCGHIYHTECISEWIKRNNTCPSCRINV
tara:strand:+ start:151 stop:507 length:357 start_codon:yes stop_codon:yes gene_type:complete